MKLWEMLTTEKLMLANVGKSEPKSEQVGAYAWVVKLVW